MLENNVTIALNKHSTYSQNLWPFLRIKTNKLFEVIHSAVKISFYRAQAIQVEAYFVLNYKPHTYIPSTLYWWADVKASI